MFSCPTWKRFSFSSIAFVVLLFNVLGFVTCAPLALVAVLLVKTKLSVPRCYSLDSTIAALLTLAVLVNVVTCQECGNHGWFKPHGPIPTTAPDDLRLCDPKESDGNVQATLTDKSCEIGLEMQTGTELKFDLETKLGDEKDECHQYRDLFNISVSTGCEIQFSITNGASVLLLAKATASKEIRVLKEHFDGTASVTLNNNGGLNADGGSSAKSGCQITYCGAKIVRVKLRGGSKIKSCSVRLTFNQATFVLDGKYQPTTTTMMNTTAVTVANVSYSGGTRSHQLAESGLTATHWIIIYSGSGAVGLVILVCVCCCVIISSRSKKRRAAQAATTATKSVQPSTNTSPEKLISKPPTGPKKSSTSKESHAAEKDHSDMVTERIFTEPNKPTLSGHGALDRSAHSIDRADQHKPLESPMPRKILLPGEKRMQATADYNTMNDVQSDWISEDKAIGAPNKRQATAEIKKMRATQTTQKFTETTQKSGENEDAGSPHRADRSPDDGSAHRRGSGSRRNDEALRTRSTVLDTLGPSRDRTTQQTREPTGERTTQATVNKTQH